MTRLLILAALAFGAAHCGGNLRPPDPVDSFVGTWDGHFTTAIGVEAPREYDAPITISAVTHNTARVDGLCPGQQTDGEAIIVAGFDNVGAWQGMVECAPTMLEGCFVIFRYTDVRVVVAPETGTIAVNATGSARDTGPSTQCQETKPLAVAFSGVAMATE